MNSATLDLEAPQASSEILLVGEANNSGAIVDKSSRHALLNLPAVTVLNSNLRATLALVSSGVWSETGGPPLQRLLPRNLPRRGQAPPQNERPLPHQTLTHILSKL